MLCPDRRVGVINNCTNPARPRVRLPRPKSYRSFHRQFAHETWLGDLLTLINVHKNQLKVVEPEGSFSVANESAHTVETTAVLVGALSDS